MQRITRYFRVGVLAVLAATSSLGSYAGQTEKDRNADAKHLLELETKGDYAAVAARVASNSKRTLTQDTIRTRWTGIVRRAGPLKSMGTPKQQKLNQYDLVVIPCKFSKGDVDSKIVFDTDGQIVAFFFVPSPGSKVPAERSRPSGPPRGPGGFGGRPSGRS